MRYVLIGPTYPYRGGISHYTTLLYHHLRAAHEVKLYSFKKQYPAFLFPGRTDKDPSRFPLRADCEYLLDPSNPLTWLQTFRRIKGDRPDVLILQWWVPYWAPAFASIAGLVRRFTATRVMFICHNVFPHERSAIDRALVRLTLTQGQFFIVQSEKDLNDLKRLMPRAEVRRTAHPIYETLARDRTMTAEEAKKQLGVKGKVLLFFGFVREYKGLRYLLGAMPQVMERVDVHLLVVGEFWDDKSAYLNLIEELGIAPAVTIVDRYIPNEELGLYFSAADVVVLPYVDATQSGVAQLAYGFGKPVITTSVGGIPEVVRDGETGLIVPPQDSEALGKAIVRYFEEDLGARFTLNIRAQVQEGAFSWSRLVRLIEEMTQQ
jgi:glycosyltransferase involved in cell wall biosynthesis